MARILFVCLGNICRSPLMEGLARAQCADAGHGFDSAGIGAWHAGQPPDPRAIAVAARHGIDIAAQRARQVVAADFTRFDAILAADRSVLAQLHARAPAGASAELALLLEWAGLEPGGDIDDPYTGGEAQFAAAFARIAAATAGLARRLHAG
jgi:protein-tyrosine phosphatase